MKLKKNQFKNYAVFAADFETTHHREFTTEEILLERTHDDNNDLPSRPDFHPNESSQVFLSGIQSLKTDKYFLCYEDIADTLDVISKQTWNEGKYKALVFYHNATYDFSYILAWLLQNGWKQTLKTDSFGRPLLYHKEFQLLASGNKFFKAELYWKGVRIEFRDSLKLLPAALDDLGESFLKIKKLKENVDYSKFELKSDHNYDDKWIEYLKRDVEILSKVLILYYNNEKKATVKKLTAGAVAYSYVKNIVDRVIPNFTIADYEQFNAFYKGGLCFPSIIYQAKWVVAKNRIKMIDITSSYPYQMTKKLPFGKPFKEIQENWKSYCSFHKVKICSANIKKQYCDIGCMWKPFEVQDCERIVKITDSKALAVYQYLQNVENEIYYLTDVELDMWNQLYDMKYEILDTWYFETDDFLKDVVLELYTAKEDAKKRGDEVAKNIYKIRLNSIYGKFGQKWRRTMDFWGNKEELEEQGYILEGNKNSYYTGYNVRKQTTLEDKAKPVFLGAYITALARVYLLKQYKHITDNGGKFLYCDTDSICYVDSEEGIKVLNEGSELGQWEPEKFKVADAFCSLCPKQYRIVSGNKVVKTACAGLDKKQMYNVKNQDYNFDLGKNNSYNLHKTQLKNSVNGKVVWDSPFNFDKWAFKQNPICPKELYN